MNKHYKKYKFPYLWKLSDGYPSKNIEYHGCKVFGTFICGGGSSMGYKLAGFEHLGGVELDPKISAIYEDNHHPKYLYTMDIRDFNKLEDLPEELYNLDVLDGSPPCSTFSISGSREESWGKAKRFTEGQKMQRLDDLVFIYCNTIEKLKPKVCLLENVSGLVKGNGKIYAKKIAKRLDEIGYKVQVFLLNSATMGVPQIRERCFFIGLRKDFSLPKLELNFNEKPIPFREIDEGDTIVQNKIRKCDMPYFDECEQGKSIATVHPKGSFFNAIKLAMDKPANTLAAGSNLYHPTLKRGLNNSELLKISSFPVDYHHPAGKTNFLCGMSVPPVMIAQISHQIYIQWLQKINTTQIKATDSAKAVDLTTIK